MQLDDFVLYLDENLQHCKPILEALRSNDVQFRCHDAYFRRGEDDEVWLPQVAEWGWVVLTKDKRNRYNELERVAVERHRVREFYFSAGNMNGAEMAQALTTALEQMRNAIRENNRPLIASITKMGTITILFDEHGSTHQRRKIKSALTKE